MNPQVKIWLGVNCIFIIAMIIHFFKAFWNRSRAFHQVIVMLNENDIRWHSPKSEFKDIMVSSFIAIVVLLATIALIWSAHYIWAGIFQFLSMILLLIAILLAK